MVTITSRFPADIEQWNSDSPSKWEEKIYQCELKEIYCVEPMVWGDQQGIRIYIIGGGWHFTTKQIYLR